MFCFFRRYVHSSSFCVGSTNFKLEAIKAHTRSDARKKDGTHRMILNLKNRNQHANKIHFKRDTLNTIIKLVDKDCFMASIDLKDAYYSVPIAAPYRKYLRFSWRGSLYQFTCLPNGLSCGPGKFIKLLKPALSDDLHLKGHIQWLY